MIDTRRTFNQIINAQFGDGLTMYFSKEDTISSDSDGSEDVCLIKTGFVKAFHLSNTNEENILLFYGAGELIPFPWELILRHTSTIYYQALTDVTVIRKPKAEILLALSDNQWLSHEMFDQAVTVAGYYTRRLQTLQLSSAYERVVSEIIYLSERFGTLDSEGILINVPLTHLDIANSINMTRETASRALGQLIKEGYIIQRDHFFIVLHFEKLRSTIQNR